MWVFWTKGRFWMQRNALLLKNTCLSVPRGRHMSRSQMLSSFQQHPLSSRVQCCTRGARYATSPQSVGEGGPEGEAPPRGWPALSEPSSHREPLKQNEISDAKTSHTPARASRPTAAASAAEPIAVYHLYNLLDVSSSEEPS